MFDFFLELLDECGVLVLSLAKASNLDKITRELVKIMDTTKVKYRNKIDLKYEFKTYILTY